MSRQVTKEQIAKAREMDLFTYLSNHDPGELVHIKGDVYCTKAHDSLKINNGKWMWWSRRTGGRSALDYLIKVEGMEFTDAVRHMCDVQNYIPRSRFQPIVCGSRLDSRETLAGELLAKSRFGQFSQKKTYTNRANDAPKEKKPFTLPTANSNNNRVISYLKARGIDNELIIQMIEEGRLYEDLRHNCVFVGFDNAGVPRHATLRSSSKFTTFVGDVEGGDKRFAFSLPENKQSNEVHIFESAIDALSFYTLEADGNENFTPTNYITLCGVYGRRQDGDAVLPVALTQFLQDNPHITTLNLCLDNDKAGHEMAEILKERLADTYKVNDYSAFLVDMKDFNEMLMVHKGLERVQTRGQRFINNTQR